MNRFNYFSSLRTRILSGDAALSSQTLTGGVGPRSPGTLGSPTPGLLVAAPGEDPAVPPTELGSLSLTGHGGG